MLDIDVINESGEGYMTHYPDEDEALWLAEKNGCIVAFY